MNAITAPVLLTPVPMTIAQWLKVRDVLLPAIDRLGGTHTETDIAAMLLAGHARLWVTGRSAMVTEIRIYPRLKELSILVAGGTLRELLGLRVSLEAHARDHGCSRIRSEGRWGWRRWEGERTGFRFLAATLVKDL